ncbi:MAG: hypothetical protein JNL97_08555 [Verrucomicrobiales bacterium]|nr:hypothetical protein [Verrucomicrobiales bacterium]
MNDETTRAEALERDAPEETTGPVITDGWVSRTWWGLVKWFAGAALMQWPAGAVVVAGWLQRFLRRAVYRQWWLRCRGRVGRYDEFVAEEPLLGEFRHAPNWVLAQEFRTRWAAGPREGRGRRRWRLLRESLTANVASGLQVLANVWALTLPGCVLWAAGWWGGWQNSFHKGYEHFGVGPAVSVLGIVVFVAALLYVPMATARQAATGNWRAFWHGRTIWTLLKSSWLPGACVAVLFAASNVLVMGLKSWPQFLPQARMAALARRGMDPTEAHRAGLESVDWSALTDLQATSLLNRHFLASAGVVFLVLIVLKRAVAWLYAGAVLRAVRRGALGEEALGDTEWRVLHSLGALEVRDRPMRGVLIRLVAWAGTKMGRVVCGFVTIAAGFVFVAAIYVSEFLSYHPMVGWLNQPLIQLPWFRYVPATLENPAGQLLAGSALVLGAVCVAAHRARRRSGARS